MAETAALLADEVLPERPLRQWMLSLPFALRFWLATDPDSLTLIQRFGSALNLNIHVHMILLDGVYVPVQGATPVFRHVPAPTGTELQEVVQQITARIGKVLEQRGLVERDMENAWLAMQGEVGPLDDLIGHYHLSHRGGAARRPEAVYAADGCSGQSRRGRAAG